jgi:hypothetical protein
MRVERCTSGNDMTSQPIRLIVVSRPLYVR